MTERVGITDKDRQEKVFDKKTELIQTGDGIKIRTYGGDLKRKEQNNFLRLTISYHTDEHHSIF